jgi:hypothetical protein
VSVSCCLNLCVVISSFNLRSVGIQFFRFHELSSLLPVKYVVILVLVFYAASFSFSFHCVIRRDLYQMFDSVSCYTCSHLHLVDVTFKMDNQHKVKAVHFKTVFVCCIHGGRELALCGIRLT